MISGMTWNYEKPIEECLPNREELLRIYGKRLKALRKKAGITQEELACRISERWDANTVYRYESGRLEMHISDVEMISLALNCSPEELMIAISPSDNLDFTSAYDCLTEENKKAINHLIQLFLLEQKLIKS